MKKQKTRIANKEMKTIKKLANKKILLALFIMIFILATILSNLLVNSIELLFDNIGGMSKEFNIISSLFKIQIFNNPVIYIIAYLIAIAVIIKINFNLKASFSDLKEGQKGTSRFTTLEEIKEQYKAIPNKKDTFKGTGGIPISSYKNKIFIDDSPVNNLIIGTTRSGKGEMLVVPMIDIYSRAEEKASLIINDPKGELIAMSRETLEKRGYRVEMLNLLNPMNSMSYNPLQLIIDAYEDKKYSEAQTLCKTLTYSLYYKPGAKDPFWQNSAMSLVNALILAIIDDCLLKYRALEKEIEKLQEKKEELKEENNEHWISKIDKRIEELKEEIKKVKGKRTLYTVANMLSELGSKEDFQGKNELDKYFENLPSNSVAKMQYATSNFTKGSARGSIFATAMAELQIFTLDENAKMTSKNSIDLKDIGFKNEKDNRPIALFMVSPDYDASNHILASIFIRQVYYILSKSASLSKSSKCDREVIFLLDEFGNMTAIEGMANIITVCLGRRIKFNLVIQAYSQLKKLYGDDYKTIIGNCGNQVYVLTNENETAEEFSKLIGEKTITTYSRSGEILDTTKHQTESVDVRRLLKAEELRSLKPGETVVVRVTKRNDLKGNKVTPYPIFNTRETSNKFRYEYLNDDFDNANSFLDVNINALHKDIDLNELFFVNYRKQLEEKLKEVEDNKNKEKDSVKIEKNEYENTEKTIVLSEIFTLDELDEIGSIIDKYFDVCSINMNTTWREFKEFCEEKNNNSLNFYLEKGTKELKKRGEV